MRNRNIFGPPGIAYVYLSYGTHNLLNVVCEPDGVGSAVLIRALRPSDGEDLMERRRGRARDLCNGPGRLTQALGVGLSYDGQDLTSGSLIISDGGAPPEGIVETTRIGITRGTDLPWRYLVDGDQHVSVPPKTVSGRRRRAESSRPGSGAKILYDAPVAVPAFGPPWFPRLVFFW
jgi:DNA-3-methyladenine glycosylase